MVDQWETRKKVAKKEQEAPTLPEENHNNQNNYDENINLQVENATLVNKLKRAETESDNLKRKAKKLQDEHIEAKKSSKHIKAENKESKKKIRKWKQKTRQW